jgi:malonyl-CoA O-methyltransferase
MHSAPKDKIAASFGRRAPDYDDHAQVQRHVAEKLAGLLPPLPSDARILEIGCGTGLLTAHLIRLYPHASLHITDIAPEMIARAQNKFPPHARLHYSVMDGEHPATDDSYDMIVSSMCVQWFSDPLAGLERLKHQLKPHGQLYYATIGAAAFQEWKDAADALGLAHGFLPSPAWPDIAQEERIAQSYDSAMDFLKEIKGVGANQPIAGYKPLRAAALKTLATECEKRYSSTITWHIVYGAYTRTA